ncbi:electron transfer flavoprotein subunit alpha/FixB family protein [Chloroflexota bacterium]
MAEQVLVFIERDGNEIVNISRQIAIRGREQADTLNAQLCALILGHHIEEIVESLSEMDFDVLYVVDDGSFEHYNPEVYTKALSKILSDIAPRTVLLADTYITREIGPAVASRLGVPFLNSCADFELSETKVVVTQPKYGGTIYVKAELEPLPSMVLISLQSSPIPADMVSTRTPSIEPVQFKVDTQELNTMVVAITKDESVDVDITKADIVVSGGRGLGARENISLIQDVAQALGGVIACSRPLCDLGWLSLGYLVGMSGKSISPNVYLACGISGATQHTAAITGAKRIIAINKDANAPIFRTADFGVVGDLFKILPAVINEAKRVITDKKQPS